MRINSLRLSQVSQTRLTGFVAVVAILSWIAVNLVFTSANLNWIEESDTGDYWKASKTLGEFPAIELPFYPALIAGLRTIFSDTLVVAILQGINLAAYTLAVVVMYWTMQAMGLRMALAGSLIFALYPLVAVTNAVFPRINAILLVTITVALFSYLTGKKWVLIVALILALLMHKSAWPLVILMILIGIWEKKFKLFSVIFIILPLFVYWLAGASYHNDLLWIVRGSYEVQFASRSNIPVVDGIVSMMSEVANGSASALVKSILVFGHVGVIVLLIASGIWKRNYLFLPLLITPIIFFFTLNSIQVLATVNYTTYVALPLTVFLSEKRYRWAESRWFLGGLLVGLFLSQLIYAFYVVRFLRT